MNEHISEPLDRNKTVLTHQITACAIAYLANRGFKPIETEVPVADGWIADIASFCYPNPTEFKNLGIKLKPPIKIESEYSELSFYYGPLLTALVEVKVSKTDFKKDLTTKFFGRNFPANLCYIAYPQDLITKEEIPYGWIGLEVHLGSERVIRKCSKFISLEVHPQHPGIVADFIAQIAIRREHRTRYAANRAWLKMYRAKGMDY